MARPLRRSARADSLGVLESAGGGQSSFWKGVGLSNALFSILVKAAKSALVRKGDMEIEGVGGNGAAGRIRMVYS